MSRFGLHDGVQRYATDGALPAHRIVKLGSDGFPDLAGAADENSIGVTRGAVDAATDSNRGPSIALRNNPGLKLVEVAAGASLEPGDVGYQAANGMLSDSGTVRAGVCHTGGTQGDLVELQMDAGFAYAAPS